MDTPGCRHVPQRRELQGEPQGASWTWWLLTDYVTHGLVGLEGQEVLAQGLCGRGQMLAELGAWGWGPWGSWGLLSGLPGRHLPGGSLSSRPEVPRDRGKSSCRFPKPRPSSKAAVLSASAPPARASAALRVDLSQRQPHCVLVFMF